MQIKSIPNVMFLCITFALSIARADDPAASGYVDFLDTAPKDVRTGKLEDSGRAVIFAERLDFSADVPIKIDVSRPGDVVKLEDRTGKQGKVKHGKKVSRILSPSVVAKGRRINSYYIHFDPVGRQDTERVATGSVTFDDEVIGLVISTENLIASNRIAGSPSTQYPTGQAQDLELNKSTQLSLSADRRTVSFKLCASTHADNIRVITKAQGEPAIPQRPRSPGEAGRRNDEPVHDLLAVPSKWSGQRANTTQGVSTNCQIHVTGRKGKIYTIDFTEHHASLRITMNFRLKGRELILTGWKNRSIADWTIQNLQAKGSTDGEGMQIGYRWVQSGRGYQNALIQGEIDVTRDR